MNNIKIFQNTWTLQQLPATMKLSSHEWRFLLCADGKTTVDQIQHRLGLSEQDRETILANLCASNLLTELSLSVEEYARATVDLPVARSESPQTFAEYLQTTGSASPSPKKNMPTFSPLQKPPVSISATPAMSLQSVIQFILNQNPDPTTGHLATYQVFMGINTKLLKRNGITSLRFQDDRFITDPELQAAIADNIRNVLKVACPEEVYFHPPTASKK